MTELPDPGHIPSRRNQPRQRDFATMGMSANRPERPRLLAWGPGPDQACAPILAALRAEGFEAWIGSRREPANNFEVSCLYGDIARVADIITAIDPGAVRLDVGR